jgi:hypothetical protein
VPPRLDAVEKKWGSKLDAVQKKWGVKLDAVQKNSDVISHSDWTLWRRNSNRL